MLNTGRWGGTQVVSSAWVRQASATSPKLNAGYGYLWWLNRKGLLVRPFDATSERPTGNPTYGRIVPGAPSSLFWALGRGNQLIQVDPDSETVVVRLGLAETNPRPPRFGPAEASKVVTEAVVRR